MKRQTLPFRISILKTAAELNEAVKHRAHGYGRRSRALGGALEMPEAADARVHGREILIATSKMDGAIIGSLRLEVNINGPVSVQKYAEMPERIATKKIMDANRFCCLGGTVCRVALFKAAMLYGSAHGVDHFVIATLATIQPLYASVGFIPLFDDGRMHPIPSAENLPHRIMELDLRDARALIAQRRPAILDFLYETDHGDDIFVGDAMEA